MYALSKAQTPRTIGAATWALEKATGIKSVDLIRGASTGISGGGSTLDHNWYTDNGYYRISGALGGYSSYTGRAVTADASLESSAVYACIKIIAEDMGSLPFTTYQRSDDRKSVEKAYEHPLYTALHDLPNPELSAGEFVEMLTAHVAMGLDGFAEVQRVGKRINLWPWMPTEVSIRRNSKSAIFYIRKEGNAAEKTYSRDQVFHLRGFTLDGVRGDEIMRRARHVLGLTLATQEYAGRFFANDASPGIIIQRPAGLAPWGPEEVKNVKKAWMEWHQGLHRAHEPAITQEGATVTRLDPDHQKLQMNEQRRFQVVEVARLWRMPLHKLADLERATNNNIEHQGIEYVSQTLRPYVRRWREAVYRCLLTVNEQLADQIYAEHNVEALQRGDFANQSEGFRKLLEKGVYSINEVRRYINLNPVEGGDEHFIQLNMATVQDVASGASIPDKTPAPELVPVKGKQYVNGSLQ